MCFVSASGQNVFFTELLAAIADEMKDRGITVEHSLDCFPQLRDGLVYVFVPHELLPLTMPDAHPRPAQLRRSVVICTEQPGTTWFGEAASVAERAGAAVDISRLGVRALRKRGVDARLLQLGYVPAWDHWGGTDGGPRPVDLTFQGGATARRTLALARAAGRLVGRRSEVHLVESDTPHTGDSCDFLAGTAKWELLSSSRLMVNVHRSELGYLEWLRVVGAIANGCVVLSEHSLGFEPLVPGEHFVSVSFDSIGVALEALLDDEPRIERIRHAAYRFLREQHPMSSCVEVLASLTSELARPPLPRTDLRLTPALPMPRPPEAPPTEFQRIFSRRTATSVIRMVLKQLLLEQRALRAELRDLRSHVPLEEQEGFTVESLGPSGQERPKVSVVMTVYNYATLVGGAIRSVATSEFEDYELLVIDDASTDHSAAAIRRAVEQAPWMSTKILTRAHNRGLARARNLGVEIARGELVFIIDADNAIYPHALGRLSATLDEHPEASFAYGIIEMFGTSGPEGLASYLAWDPLRLRYGNYIDAMAMIRREAVLSADGYTTDGRLFGWEDFALWCAMAQEGRHGIRVPEVLARYRVALHSMISLTNIDGTVAWSTLLDRYPFLSAGAPLQRA